MLIKSTKMPILPELSSLMSSFGTSHHNTPVYRIQEMNAPQNVLQAICSGKVVLLQDPTRRNETMYLFESTCVICEIFLQIYNSRM